jgi:transcriptional regulator ATRX
LADLLNEQKDWIVKYHEHDSLLQHIEDEVLSEKDRKDAWEEYEAEKSGKPHSMFLVFIYLYKFNV